MESSRVAGELIRALRGKRSQRWLSRRLGYASNVIYRWETGRAWPAAEDFFRLAAVVGQNPSEGLRDFRADWSGTTSLNQREGVTRLLELVREKMPIVEIARRLGRSRFVISRWLGGETAIRLPELLEFVQVCSLRALDFVAALANPEKLPSIRESYRSLEASRKAAYENPWSHAVLRVLELDSYARLKRHREGFIACRLGISREQERDCLELLEQAGQIEFDGCRYVVHEVRILDIRRQQKKSREIKGFWLDVNRERLAAGAPGTYGYNLFSVSRADHERIVQLYLRFYHDLQQIVASSERPEEVVLMTTQIVGLDRTA